PPGPGISALSLLRNHRAAGCPPCRSPPRCRRLPVGRRETCTPPASAVCLAWPAGSPVGPTPSTTAIVHLLVKRRGRPGAGEVAPARVGVFGKDPVRAPFCKGVDCGLLTPATTAPGSQHSGQHLLGQLGERLL